MVAALLLLACLPGSFLCAGPVVADKYVSPAGSDTTGTGTIGNPYLTVEKGLVNVSAGETVWMRGNAGNYAAQTIDAAGASGSSGNPKYVKPYPGEQAVISGRLLLHEVADYIHFVGDPDVRLGVTAGTIRVVNHTDGQHVVEMYGTGNRLEGMDLDGGTQNRTDGSIIVMGFNGSAGQWRNVDGVVTNNLIRHIGLTPGLASGDPGHNHGIYLNYNLNSEISYNVIVDIQAGWGIHAYTESGSARHVDGTSIHHNTIVDTRNGGIMLASDGNSTTKNSTVDDNLCVDIGNPAITYLNYSYDVYWGGPTGTGNTGTNNHSHNPSDGDTNPDIPTGWALDDPVNGDPLFVDQAGGDWRLETGSPAETRGAFPDPEPGGGEPRHWAWV